MRHALAHLSLFGVTCARHSQPLALPRAAFVTSSTSTLSRLIRPTRQAAASKIMSGTADLPYRYRWPRPAVTVDCLIYALEEGEPWILLIKRKNDPFQGAWALPGGFIGENESLDKAARRELEEETGVSNCTMVQTGAYGDPGRDPRGHTITVAFMAWAQSKASCNPKAGDDAAEAEFYPLTRLPKMAFDHLKVISDAWARCRFETQEDGSDSGAVAVVDRASDQALGVYHATGITIESLAALRPTEHGRA